uniref:Uncharacterized protein n=1 Tax=Hyaloperonospora arabidopsidis (strain Emoy2) TaxID=559515 RepID=M4C4H1_HYAAE
MRTAMSSRPRRLALRHRTQRALRHRAQLELRHRARHALHHRARHVPRHRARTRAASCFGKTSVGGVLDRVRNGLATYCLQDFIMMPLLSRSRSKEVLSP